MAKIAVVHLVRKGNDIKLLLSFIESYLKYNAGVDHDLVLIFKGYKKGDGVDVLMTNMLNVNYTPVYTDDVGMDIDTYFGVAKKMQYEYFIFFNSYSIISNYDWLLKYYKLCANKSVGIVGATGSYESPLRNWIDEYFKNTKYNIQSFIRLLRLIKQYFYLRLFYPDYPNPHVRTNAFMISADCLNIIQYKQKLNRSQALRLESGKNSITQQLMKHKLKTLVVDKYGKGYDVENWRESKTFRWNNQENLLVSDNRTREYEGQNQFIRKKISFLTWGA